MDEIIQKASKGEQTALTQLYEGCKRELYYLCRALIRNDKTAFLASKWAVKSAFEALARGDIQTEEEFLNHAVKRGAEYCKKDILSRDAHAFKIPPQKNFRISSVNEENIDPKAGPVGNYINCLPAIQRFALFLGMIAGMDNHQIAEIIGLDLAHMDAIKEHETESLTKIHMVVRAKGIRCIYPGKEQLSKAFYDELIKSPVPEELDKCIDGYFASLRTPAEQAAQNKRKIKCILTLAALIIAVIFLASSIHKEQNVSAISDNKAEELHERSDENPHESTDEPETTTSDSNDAADVSQMTYYADIEIQDYGTITVQLDQIAAPITTANFISLAQSGFYDGLTFHHIIEDFMMQGGDPEADGTGGAEESIIGEFSENGYDNPLSHTRGAISMARSSDYDSASSQFFIVHEDSTFLDGQYAVFGYVTQGMDVVDAVCEGAEPTDDNGSIAADAQPVILSVTIRAIQNES